MAGSAAQALRDCCSLLVTAGAGLLPQLLASHGGSLSEEQFSLDFRVWPFVRHSKSVGSRFSKWGISTSVCFVLS